MLQLKPNEDTKKGPAVATPSVLRRPSGNTACPRSKLLASAAPFEPTPTPTPAQPQWCTPMFGGSAIASYVPIILEAASIAFGDDLGEVDGDPADSVVVRAGGEWQDQWVMLDALGNAIWQLL